jgi:hypothetical protein
MKAMILTVIIVLSLLKTAHATPIPQEIADQLKVPGQVLATYQLLYDYDLKHLIYAQHGNLFIITYARWVDHMWKWETEDLLEIFIAVNKKPHILWSRYSPP